MGGNLRKLVSKIFSDKKVLIFSLGLVLFLTLLPLHSAQAWSPVSWIGDILQYIISLPVRFVVFGLALVLFVTGLMMGYISFVIIAVLNWFITATMSLRVLPDLSVGAPQFLVDGWNFSLDFVNIFFILILAFIGLSTILRLQTYQMQKTLPALIIIALLVNFSGVLVAFIVDIANVVTGFFLKQVPTDGMGVLEDQLNYLKDTAIQLFTQMSGGIPDLLGEAIGVLLRGVVMTIFYLFQTIVYFVVMLVFFLRAIVLWLLVILSPFAFFFYILPNTKKWWNQWLQTLIQWSIVGIPIGFFLFISNKIKSSTAESLFQQATSTFSVGELGIIDETALTKLIGGFLIPAASLVFLFVGVTLSMQMAPSGAQGIINWGKKAGLRTAGWAGREGWRNIAKGKRIEELSGKVRQWGQDTSIMAGLEKEQAKKDGKLNLWTRSKLGLKSATGKAVGAGAWGAQMGSAKINEGIRAKDRSEIEKEQKAIGNDSKQGMDRLRKGLKTPGLQNWSQFVGDVTQIIKNGDADDIEKAIARGEVDRSLLPKVYKNAMENGNIPEARLIAKTFLGRSLGKDNEMGVSEEEQEKLLDKITADDLKNMASENLDVNAAGEKGEMAKQVVNTMLLKGDSQLVPAMLRMKKKQREAIWGHIQGKGAQWFIDNGREDTLRWSASTAARGLGLGSIGDLDSKQIEDILKERTSHAKPDADLRTEVGQIDEQIKALDESGTLTKGQKKQRSNLLKRKNIIEDELKFREKDPVILETQRQALSEEKTRLEGEIIKNPKDASLYAAKASNDRELRRTEWELKRRGKVETPIVSEEEPIIIQSKKMLEREVDLRRRMPTLYGLAKDNAKKELKELISKQKKLGQQFAKLPYDQALLEYSGIGLTFQEIQGREKDKNSLIKELDRIKSLKEKAAPEDLVELSARERDAQTKIGQVNREIQRLTAEQKDQMKLRKPIVEREDRRSPQIGMAKNVIKLREKLEITKSRLTNLKIAKAPLAEIKDIQRDIKEAQENLRAQERQLTTRLWINEYQKAGMTQEASDMERDMQTLSSLAGKLEAEMSDDEKRERDRITDYMELYRQDKYLGKEMESLIKKQKEQL